MAIASAISDNASPTPSVSTSSGSIVPRALGEACLHALEVLGPAQIPDLRSYAASGLRQSFNEGSLTLALLWKLLHSPTGKFRANQILQGKEEIVFRKGSLSVTISYDRLDKRAAVTWAVHEHDREVCRLELDAYSWGIEPAEFTFAPQCFFNFDDAAKRLSHLISACSWLIEKGQKHNAASDWEQFEELCALLQQHLTSERNHHQTLDDLEARVQKLFGPSGSITFSV